MNICPHTSPIAYTLIHIVVLGTSIIVITQLVKLVEIAF
jgi:hypothetical protein